MAVETVNVLFSVVAAFVAAVRDTKNRRNFIGVVGLWNSDAIVAVRLERGGIYVDDVASGAAWASSLTGEGGDQAVGSDSTAEMIGGICNEKVAVRGQRLNRPGRADFADRVVTRVGQISGTLRLGGNCHRTPDPRFSQRPVAKSHTCLVMMTTRLRTCGSPQAAASMAKFSMWRCSTRPGRGLHDPTWRLNRRATFL